MKTPKSSIPEYEEIEPLLRGYVLKGQYKKGADLAKKTLKKYPDEFYYQYQYAKLLGDWADDLPIGRRKKIKFQAANILRPLTKRLAGKTISDRFGVCLNYYYQTSAFQEMYEYGKRFTIIDRRLGLYAQAWVRA